MTALSRVTQAGEVVAYGVLALTGAAAAITAVGYGLFVENGRVGPGLVPATGGALLAVLGVVLLLRARVAGRPAEPPSVEDVDIHGRDKAARVRHLWTVFGLLLLTIVAVNLLGFLVAFGAFVFVVSAWVERRRLLPSAVTTVVASAVVYALFVVFLRVPLPPGLLGI
jgi:putative tricarboxylic transport membrane protein